MITGVDLAGILGGRMVSAEGGSVPWDPEQSPGRKRILSQRAAVPEQQPFELSETVTLCSLEGNEFHRCGGPAVVKHRSPKVLFDRRTAHIAVTVERSRRMMMSDRQSSDIVG